KPSRRGELRLPKRTPDYLCIRRLAHMAFHLRKVELSTWRLFQERVHGSPPRGSLRLAQTFSPTGHSDPRCRRMICALWLEVWCRTAMRRPEFRKGEALCLLCSTASRPKDLPGELLLQWFAWRC